MKSHRRSDSSTSDISAHPDTFTKPPNGKTTPLSSPMILQHPTHLASPQTISNSLKSTMSSPKKLLTPIKRMFGHHSKSNTNIASANDSLNSAVYGDFVPPKGRAKYTRSASSFLNFSDIPTESLSPSSIHKPQDISADRKQIAISTTPKWVTLDNLSDSSFELQGKVGHSRGKGKYLVPESYGGSKLATTLSNFSIANSENNFMARLVLSQDRSANHANKLESEEPNDEGSVNSDTSSQFSFVKDIRGGRNTSVKYYKTKSSKPNTRAMDKQTEICDNDMGYEDGVLSDYDFENNGFGYEEEEEDYDDFEAEDKYNDFLQDDRSDIGLGLGLTGADLSSNKIFAQDVYPSSPLDSIELDLPIAAASPTESNYQSELLDAYLGDTSSKLPISDNFPQSLYIALSDSGEINPGSPLVNGITFGTGQKIRSSRKSTRNNILTASKNDHDDNTLPEIVANPNPDETSKSNRDSISNMMNMLSALEDNNKVLKQQEKIEVSDSIQNIKSILSDIKENPESKNKGSSIRNLITNMMDTLANLEETLDSSEKMAPSNITAVSKQTRSSVIEMMNTLAILESTVCEKPSLKAHTEEPASTSSDEAYWSKSRNNREESSSLAARPMSDLYEEDDANDMADNSTNALEEDLLDEVNLLPEDYDADDDDYNETEDLPQFFRSNSYNKKPQKILIDTSFQKNKIETSSKTVTFYNKNNSLQSEISNSRSTSRVGSFKSTTSGTSIAEDDISNREMTRVKGHIPHSVYTSSHFNSNSNESIGYRSFNLEPITEFNSPNL